MAVLVGMAVILGVCAVMDCLWKRIWMPFVAVAAIYICFCLYLMDINIWGRIFSGAVIGGFFLCCSVATKGQIGKADGVILGLSVAALGVVSGMAFLFLCLLYAFIAALILMILFHKKRQTRIPFVPFMLLGYMTVLLL